MNLRAQPLDWLAGMTEINELFPDRRQLGGSTLFQVQSILLRILRIVDYICTRNGLTYWLDGGTLLGAIRHRGFIPWDDDIDIVMPREDYEIFLQVAPTVLPDDLALQLAGEGNDYNCYAVPCKLRDKYSVITSTYPHSMADLMHGLFVDIIPIDKYRCRGFGKIFDRSIKWLFRNLSRVNDARHAKPNNHFHRAIYNALSLGRPFLTAETPIKYLRKYIYKRRIPRSKAIDYPAALGYGFDVHWTRIFRERDIYPLRRIRFEGYDFLAPNNPDSVLQIFYGTDYMTLPSEAERTPRHYISIVTDTRSEREQPTGRAGINRNQ